MSPDQQPLRSNQSANQPVNYLHIEKSTTRGPHTKQNSFMPDFSSAATQANDDTFSPFESFLLNLLQKNNGGDNNKPAKRIKDTQLSDFSQINQIVNA